MVNEEGEPVAGATLKPCYPGPPAIHCPAVIADRSGDAVIEHVGSAPLDVRVAAEGYESDEIDHMLLDPAKPYRWKLKKAQALKGMIFSAATGRPVAGGKIKLAGVRVPHEETHSDPALAPLLATSDAQGAFQLTTLRPDSLYYLFVDAPGYGGILLSEVKAGQPEINTKLGT